MTEQVRRIALFGAVIGGLWALGLFLDIVLLPVAWNRPVSIPGIALDVSGIVAAGIMIWFARYCRHTTLETKTDISLGYLILNGIGVAILNTWILPPVAGPAPRLSWVTVGMLMFSMIAPASPRKMLATTLVTASLDPLAMWIAALTGNPVATLAQGALMAIPNYTCAVVAVLPSKLLQRIGHRLREAQEMGSYQLIEPLGSGGMGEVWRAKHRLLARDAAIKLIRPEVLGVRNEAEVRLAMRRFEREAQATAQLSSPHSIQLFDFGVTQDETFYYVMELLSGRDLESLVREFGPLPANRVLYLMRQACHSLADAHARGLVHRDIKPANIYACRMGLEYDFVKVLDFGLVKLKAAAGAADTLATLDQGTTGTPAYMAPEVILGQGDVDRRADVYSLGCVAYYLLTGQLVFEADTPMKMLVQHLHEKPVSPSQRTELPIPRELEELVMACLEKDPDKRPQDAAQLFRMAHECRTCEGWSQEHAAQWWQVHLPELGGPLTLVTPSPEPVASLATA
jgi:serine/threonine-protein kinase